MLTHTGWRPRLNSRKIAGFHIMRLEEDRQPYGGEGLFVDTDGRPADKRRSRVEVETNVLRFSTVVLLACASLAGCMTQPVPMSRLDTGTTEIPGEEGQVAVLWGPVTLADYLQHDGLLQRLPDGSLAPEAQKARWA